jgi:signal transduction histidine kinase
MTYADLAELCVLDPLGAKRILTELVEQDPRAFRLLATSATGVDGGRVRMTFARVLEGHARRDEYRDLLESWMEGESDEFTLMALRDALQGAQRRRRKAPLLADMANISSIYRYVSTRFRHRVLNLQPLIGARLEQVREAIANDCQNSMRVHSAMDELRESLRHLERILSDESDDDHFLSRKVILTHWVSTRSEKYRMQEKAVSFSHDTNNCENDEIEGVGYLLDLIFLNLWNNSLDSVRPATIRHHYQKDGTWIRITVIDDGPGLDPDDVERSFKIQHSNKGTGRGRGHLEVVEAARRLGGDAAVVKVEREGFRVRVSFPIKRDG